MTTPSKACRVELYPGDWDHIRECEAIVVREWERELGGARVGEVVFWGDLTSANQVVLRGTLGAVRTGWRWIADVVMLVDTLDRRTEAQG